MIEFALTIGLLLLCVLTVVTAALWSIETESATTAAELTARLSIAARGVGVGQANQVDTTNAVATTAAPDRLLKATMFGTPVTTQAAGCPTGVVTYPATIILCSSSSGAGATLKVTVRVYGCARSVVPVPIGGCKGGIVVDQLAVIHPPVYQQ